MNRALPIVGALALVLPLEAGETPWQEVSPDVHMRLVTADVLEPDGTTWAALEIDMPADTKTYWRVPGESGIPPQLDITEGQGVAGFEISWPYPTRETDKGYLDHVHYGHFVLPVSLELDRPDAVLQAQLTIGICSDVCVPVSVDFSHRFDFGRPDTAQELRIRQALATVPVEWTGQVAPLGAAYHDADNRVVDVDLADAELEMSGLIADLEDAPVLFGEPETGTAGDTVRFRIYGKAGSESLDGRKLVLTFMTPDGPFEVRREIRSR